MQGFKKFLLQGNLVQLAVAVVIGAVFANLITAFTEGFITPLIGIFGGVPTFGDLYFEINGSRFLYGAFVDALISFLITAAILYFFVVLPVAKVVERFVKAEEATTRECPHCLSEISKKASRCAHCTSEVVPETAA
ncbi:MULTISPECIES: MscL family protein [Nocardiopsis]|jgi:large conductance mechanosensitive channel|uniref:Large conductance mechanosensitive channel protein n=1 Tax=Nocardiopsis dassonvillei (strain ATCC 23218 / DSM 43111 / CIP 107115 / JCM 7437 / KCTC 9190 / NBRC 14626 / NCTC 10488 / NRRL B-5397 / IMRU 509) TaxID=446468 RepID=D7B7U2_NOCDD|nr:MULTISPECIES: MscL family protein [Nocardiopsis]ADH69487.1 large conductance mechanosensitive channel protein [Nocardiopsis dassonvillei subsp. dassonvillei DSM 43111]APC37492.1 mechanosensitive ion channel protein MscL [Nocardiopsis dassonvillei]ASU60437.1 mechanosensitive ion channel protein MscL [Nocardiopsis dassonvillei]MCP3014492.1 MscL family protein [Nocardiopsis dassonvillei]NKY81226.1 MscL family protein [Nocardiopsis dassonvillei]